MNFKMRAFLILFVLALALSTVFYCRSWYRNWEFVQAARRRDVQAVRTYLDAGVDVNVEGMKGTTAIGWAARQGDDPMVKLLVSRGANSDEGLFQAIAMKHTSTLKLLISAGARVNHKPRHSLITPLEHARQNGNHEAEKILIEAGAKR